MEYRLDNIMNIMASSMSAESIRMNITASNLANSGNIGSSEDGTYHAKHPVFSTITGAIAGLDNDEQSEGGVRVTDVIQSQNPLNFRSDPGNPMADQNGNIFLTDVNPIEEMTDLIAASKQYQASAEVTSTAKNLLLQTIHAIET